MNSSSSFSAVSFTSTATEHLVDWLVRDLPVTVLRAVGHDELADSIAALPPVTARVLRGGLHHYPPSLRRAALVLSADRDVPDRWQSDAAMRADIGAGVMNVVHDVESGLIHGGGQYAGFWAVQVLCCAYALNAADTTAHVQKSYQRLADAAVLGGWGQLTH